MINMIALRLKSIRTRIGLIIIKLYVLSIYIFPFWLYGFMSMTFLEMMRMCQQVAAYSFQAWCLERGAWCLVQVLVVSREPATSFRPSSPHNPLVR